MCTASSSCRIVHTSINKFYTVFQFSSPYLLSTTIGATDPQQVYNWGC